ncbi:hypothetical protein P7C70_g7430, partial [Phenoliferia sp. Uapishka_3]
MSPTDDYRSFADSSSAHPPTEEGLIMDARTAWDYLTLEKGVEPGNIAVMGQSLGTGVSAGLCAELGDEGITPRSMILVAPFSSLPSLLETYKLGNLIPVLAPFRTFPWLLKTVLRVLNTRFDTRAIIHKIKCSILILHAQNDPVIPHSHSSTLFSHLLSLHPSSPPSSPSDLSPSDTSTSKESLSLVQTLQAGQWGTIQRFKREEEGAGDVVWAEAVKGAHNEIGTGEMSVRLIRDAVKGL